MIAFIVNPVSGNGRGAKVWAEIENVLKRRGIGFTVIYTTSPGDAKIQTQKLLQGNTIPHIIAAVGGDGTVNEVVNGFYAAGIGMDCKFGYIPAGSGNDYARGNGISLNPSEALDLLLSETRGSVIDLLLIGGHVAVSSIGCGMDGQIAKTTNQAGYKKLFNRIGLGKLAYVLSLFRVLATYRPTDVVLRIDDRVINLNKVWLIAIANIPYYGGGMKICPNAVQNDGMAEICAVSGIGRWVLPFVFPLVYSGKHVKHPAVSFYSGNSIVIESSSPLVLHTDGELVSDVPIVIQVLPGRLAIV